MKSFNEYLEIIQEGKMRGPGGYKGPNRGQLVRDTEKGTYNFEINGKKQTDMKSIPDIISMLSATKSAIRVRIYDINPKEFIKEAKENLDLMNRIGGMEGITNNTTVGYIEFGLTPVYTK